ncbi:SDR family NAD(P)-dependent oxidoreductase [Thermodesulfobacteriota bacterium]
MGRKGMTLLRASIFVVDALKGVKQMDLEGKVAIVTGGGSGIGRAIALILAGDGADVVIGDVNKNVSAEVAEEIRKLGRRSLAVQTDVSSAQEVVRMVEQTTGEFGKIDILVNNAGVNSGTKNSGPLEDMEESFWTRVIDINLKGTYLCTKTVVKHMIARKSGRIVNMASGQWFRPTGTNSAYAASKGGVVSFTKAAALEMAPHGISVNVVVPGLTDTPMARLSFPKEEEWQEAITHSRLAPPLGRINQPEDIAEAVLFLTRPASRNITGQTLHVNGGSFMW